jgi:Xaa-Pro aminopeptidase
MKTDAFHFSYDLVPEEEIASRIFRLQRILKRGGLDGAFILDSVNMFYYTGTIQNGVVFVPASKTPVFFIRRSLERAERETPLKHLLPVRSYRELPDRLEDFGCGPSKIGVDETSTPVSVFRMLSAAFSDAVFEDISFSLSMIRSVKSEYEVGLIREAGRRHQLVYDQIPAMIEEGMTEWELGSAVHACMLKLGFTGFGRLAAFNGEFIGGVIAFGESGNFPSASVGPDGMVGLCPAFPFLGGKRRLKRGDVIFIDTGFAYQGYFTDVTRVFSLGPPPQAALDAHEICLEIQEAARSRLKPGTTASQIFEEVYQTEVVSRNFEEHFMGYGSNQILFLGHGIGLVIDEYPAIAGKIDCVLKENMTLALEPKKGLKGIGLVGTENTFLVTEKGGERITAGPDEIIVVS